MQLLGQPYVCENMKHRGFLISFHTLAKENKIEANRFLSLPEPSPLHQPKNKESITSGKGSIMGACGGHRALSVTCTAKLSQPFLGHLLHYFAHGSTFVAIVLQHLQHSYVAQK